MPDPKPPVAEMKSLLFARIAELRELEGRATPGPWKNDVDYLIAPVPNGRPTGENIAMFVQYPRHERIASEENCQLVTAMRNTFRASLDAHEAFLKKPVCFHQDVVEIQALYEALCGASQ